MLKAYQQGVVLAGLSAGANCWFREFSTYSVPGDLTTIPGLGFLEASFCPHYDEESNQRPSLHRLIGDQLMLPGYAADDGAAAHFVDNQLYQAVCSRPVAKVYWIENNMDGVLEKALNIIYLGQTKPE